MDVDKIADDGAEQLPEQDQLVGNANRNKVNEQKEIIEDLQWIAAYEVYDRSLAQAPLPTKSMYGLSKCSEI